MALIRMFWVIHLHRNIDEEYKEANPAYGSTHPVRPLRLPSRMASALLRLPVKIQHLVRSRLSSPCTYSWI